MTKGQFINEVANMEIGEAFDIELILPNGDQINETVTKTRWIDAHCYIIGGAMGKMFIESFYKEWSNEPTDTSKEASNIVEQFYDAYNIPHDIDIKITHKFSITIHSDNAKIINERRLDNMYFNM